MSGLEDRLGDMLSRIAMETQEIKELEQQLTDGQILANEALQRDLEGIVCGLQEHLRGLREQDIFVQQEELSVSQTETQSLRDGQQMELEAELFSHVALGKEDESSLRQEVQTLQAQLDWTRIQLHRITAVLLDPEKPARDNSSPQDTLSRSMDQVYTAVQHTRTGMKQLQRDHTHSLEQISRLQVQLQQGQDHIRKLEAQLAPGQDPVAHLEAQLVCSVDKDQDWQNEKPERPKVRPQGSERGTRHQRINRPNPLRSQGGAQLTATTEQLRALNHTVDLLLTHSQQAPSRGSQGTQDSGLGLQYLSSPEVRRQQDGPAAGEGGRWGYVPPTHTGRAERREQTPPPPAPQAVSAGLPDGLQRPAWLLCAPPAGGAALHCNVPEHRDTQTDKCICECVNKERLQAEKKKLRLETTQRQRTVRRNRQVMQVCDEVECVEKTLLRRRAELRQADRLLLEAQSCISRSRDKASSARREVVVLQQTVEDGATCLLEVIRELQEEVGELSRRRQEEEHILKEVQELRRRRRDELEGLGIDVRSATVRLADVLSDCQDSQRRLDSLISQAAQQEQKLAHQREEVREVQRQLKELREQQEALLSDHSSALSALNKDTHKLSSVQSELHAHRAELKQVLQELLREQQALQEEKNKHSQELQKLQEKRAQLDSIQEEVDRVQAELARARDKLGEKHGEVDRKREELFELQQEAELQRRREEKSSVEAQRRHADWCLSTVEAGLANQREELSNAQIPKQEVHGGRSGAA